jgi:L-aspartate oxidase
VPGLYATGEVACSGVHGANRLASNSLLEGLVFSRRIAEVLPGELRPWPDAPGPAVDARKPGLVAGGVRRDLQTVMTDRAGVLRSADGLTRALDTLQGLVGDGDAPVDQDAWETTNLVTLSLALAEAARAREETRGSHWRDDFPERDDARWAGHLDTVLVDGVTVTAFHPAAPSDAAPGTTGPDGTTP